MLVAGSEERAERQGANASGGAPAPPGAVQLRRRGNQIHLVLVALNPFCILSRYSCPGGEANGQEEGAGEGSPRGKVCCRR